jgi:hypothetical protein
MARLDRPHGRPGVRDRLPGMLNDDVTIALLRDGRPWIGPHALLARTDRVRNGPHAVSPSAPAAAALAGPAGKPRRNAPARTALTVLGRAVQAGAEEGSRATSPRRRRRPTAAGHFPAHETWRAARLWSMGQSASGDAATSMKSIAPRRSRRFISAISRRQRGQEPSNQIVSLSMSCDMGHLTETSQPNSPF